MTKTFENDCPNPSSGRLLTEKRISSVSLAFPGSLVKTSCLWDENWLLHIFYFFSAGFCLQYKPCFAYIRETSLPIVIIPSFSVLYLFSCHQGDLLGAGRVRAGLHPWRSGRSPVLIPRRPHLSTTGRMQVWWPCFVPDVWKLRLDWNHLLSNTSIRGCCSSSAS